MSAVGMSSRVGEDMPQRGMRPPFWQSYKYRRYPAIVDAASATGNQRHQCSRPNTVVHPSESIPIPHPARRYLTFDMFSVRRLVDPSGTDTHRHLRLLSTDYQACADGDYHRRRPRSHRTSPSKRVQRRLVSTAPCVQERPASSEFISIPSLSLCRCRYGVNQWELRQNTSRHT